MDGIDMKGKIAINKKSRLACIPKHMIDEGYVGSVPVLANFDTIVLLRPGSEIRDQIESMQRLVQDLEAREKAATKENVTDEKNDDETLEKNRVINEEKTTKYADDFYNFEGTRDDVRRVTGKIDKECGGIQ